MGDLGEPPVDCDGSELSAPPAAHEDAESDESTGSKPATKWVDLWHIFAFIADHCEASSEGMSLDALRLAYFAWAETHHREPVDFRLWRWFVRQHYDGVWVPARHLLGGRWMRGCEFVIGLRLVPPRSAADGEAS